MQIVLDIDHLAELAKVSPDDLEAWLRVQNAIAGFLGSTLISEPPGRPATGAAVNGHAAPDDDGPGDEAEEEEDSEPAERPVRVETPLRVRIEKLLADGEVWTMARLCQATGKGSSSVGPTLTALMAKGDVARVSQSRYQMAL